MRPSILLLVVFCLVACGSSRSDRYKTESKSYKKDISAIHPEFSVFHINDSISELNFKITSKELLYTRPDGFNFYSNVLISVRLLPSYDSKIIVDSTSIRLVDENNEGIDKFLIGKININTKTMGDYYARITVSDLNKNTDVTKVLFIQKDNELSRQNFLVRSVSTNMLLFGNTVNTDEAVVIKYKESISKKLFVGYYGRSFGLPLPPFSVSEIMPFQYLPDSTFTIEMEKGNALFTPHLTGFYHFQLDTTKRVGLTLSNFSGTFPEIKKAEDMLPPLRFLTSKDEFQELNEISNKKEAVDKFWLSCGGSKERARELIRKFYTRMQDANANYTSYVEGWKTDRGMMYLIQGPPNLIYKSATRESWVYGEENSINSITYVFSKVINPFTDNDYELQRSQQFKQLWYACVDAWRQGRSYFNN